MKAFAIDKYKDELTKRDVPDPVAGPGEVVVAINAASVNPIDERLRQGSFKAILPYDMPLTRQLDDVGAVAIEDQDGPGGDLNPGARDCLEGDVPAVLFQTT